MRKGGLISGKSKYVTVFLALVMLIGMIPFSSGTAEAWDANVSVEPQEVYTGESTEISITVENIGTDPMKVELVTISFGWQEEGKGYTPFEGEKVISPGEEATFTSTINIPGGIQTNTRYDRETTIVASDPDGFGGWQDPYPMSYSGRVLVSESNGFLELDIWIIIAIIFMVIAAIAFVGQKYFENKESTRESQQQYQQTTQQQSSVPPPSQQSSQQAEGQPPQQQTQQSPPPPSAKNCPSCNAEMRYVDEHDSWWCDSCQEYK